MKKNTQTAKAPSLKPRAKNRAKLPSLFGAGLLAFLSSVFLMAPPLFAVETIQKALLTVSWDQGRYAVQAKGEAAPFASGNEESTAKVAAVVDPDFGSGQAIEIDYADGSHGAFQVFPKFPFVLYLQTIPRRVNSRRLAFDGSHEIRAALPGRA